MHTRFGSDLQGKVVLITGASKGLGYGLAKIMAREGAHVAVAARDNSLLQNLAKEIQAEGGMCEPFLLDLRDVSSIKACVLEVEENLGSIDILVNNAGMGNPIPAENVTEQDWDWMMDLNLKGTFFCCQAVAKGMLIRKRGRIINISSQASVVAIPEESVYCASKGGVNMLTKTLAVEWAARGVTVNAVGPTFIRTPGTQERLAQPEFLQGVLDKIPVGRVATIDDVASAVLYLASDSSSMVTGTLLLVDGGWTSL